MKKKIPSLFLKKYKEKQFHARIEKKLYLKEDREWVLSLFEKDAQGFYRLIQGGEKLTEKERKRLKPLAKSIKKNTGALQKGKIIFLALFVGLILFFNALFKDRLIEHAAERGLEQVFGAASDLEGLEFRPGRALLSFRSLSVGDKEDPLFNLFQTGRSEVALNMAALMKGKVVIENLECREIRWHTPRLASAVLVQEKKEAPSREPETEKKKSSVQFPDLEAIDGEKILEMGKESLAAPGVIEESTLMIETMKEEWTARKENYAREIQGLSRSVKTLSGTKLNSLKDIQKLKKLYDQSVTVYNGITTLAGEVTRAEEQISKDLKKAEKQGAEIPLAIEKDYDNLKTFIQLPGVEKGSLLASLAGEYLGQDLELYYGYALKVLSYLNSLKEGKEQDKPAGSRGRQIYYPSRQYPRFLLEKGGLSLEEDNRSLALELAHLSSDPALAGAPFRFKVIFEEGEGAFHLEGEIKNSPSSLMEVKVKMADFPFTLDQGLTFLGLNSLSGTWSFSADLNMDQNRSPGGKIDLILQMEKHEEVTDPGIISREFLKIIEDTNEVRFSGTLQGKENLSLTSSLDELVSRRIGALLEEAVARGEKELRSALESFLAGHLEENQSVHKDLEGIRKNLEENLEELENYKKSVEARKKEIEKKISSPGVKDALSGLTGGLF